MGLDGERWEAPLDRVAPLDHFSDLYNIPAIFVYGILLEWSFHHSQSFVAHAIDNCTAILWIVFA